MSSVIHTDACAVFINVRFIYYAKTTVLQQLIDNIRQYSSCVSGDLFPSGGGYLKLQEEREAHNWTVSTFIFVRRTNLYFKMLKMCVSSV